MNHVNIHMVIITGSYSSIMMYLYNKTLRKNLLW